MDSINYEESAKMSNKNPPTLAQDDIDFEIYREALVECEYQPDAQTPPFEDTEIPPEHTVDPDLKLKILRSKREVYDLLKRQGLLPGGTTSILDESYIRTWEDFNTKGVNGLDLQNVRNSEDQVSTFLVALLKNYFLELSVDKVELMCESYVRVFKAGKSCETIEEPKDNNQFVSIQIGD